MVSTVSQSALTDQCTRSVCCDKTHQPCGCFLVSVTMTEKNKSLVPAGINPEPAHWPQQGTSEPQLLPEPQSASSPWVFHQAILLQNRSRSHTVAVSQFVLSDGQSALGRKAECCGLLCLLFRNTTSHLINHPRSHLHSPLPELPLTFTATAYFLHPEELSLKAEHTRAFRSTK